MIEPPTLSDTTAQRTAVIHITVPRQDIQQAMGAGYQELMSTLAAQGLKPTGPWFTHHLRMDPDVFDYEIGAPIEGTLSPNGRVVAGEWPAARVARTVYQGGYEGLGEAWGEFDAWIKANGLKTRDDLWENYAVGPETGPDSSQWRTELYRPLAS